MKIKAPDIFKCSRIKKPKITYIKCLISLFLICYLKNRFTKTSHFVYLDDFSMSLVSQATQIAETRERMRERIHNSAAIYSKRQDTLALKEKILAQVQSPDYWPTFAAFIHGQCSKAKYDACMADALTTDEVKELHNELIRSILFNAHFSMVPPPGYEDAPPTPIPQLPRTPPPNLVTKNGTLQTFTAADLRHLPSINQIKGRVGVLLNDLNIKVDSKAANCIITELKQYMHQILKQSLALASSGEGMGNEPLVTSAHIIHVLRNNAQLASIVSPTVMSKFAIVAQ